jgi:hypothetical protein
MLRPDLGSAAGSLERAWLRQQSPLQAAAAALQRLLHMAVLWHCNQNFCSLMLYRPCLVWFGSQQFTGLSMLHLSFML